jgi:hypothetical protein
MMDDQTPHLEDNPERGEIRVFSKGSLAQATPMADGERMFVGARVWQAQLAGRTLAVIGDFGGRMRIQLLAWPELSPIAAFPYQGQNTRFLLSPDGQRIAVQQRAEEISVYSTHASGIPLTMLDHGRTHSNLSAELGDSWMIIRVGAFSHGIRWRDGILRHSFADGNDMHLVQMTAGHDYEGQRQPATGGFVPPALRYDPRRCRLSAKKRVCITVDSLAGQICVLDRVGERLVAMVTVRRKKIAVWLPDGTRWGDDAIIGEATPDAQQRIGQALRDAEGRIG